MAVDMRPVVRHTPAKEVVGVPLTPTPTQLASALLAFVLIVTGGCQVKLSGLVTDDSPVPSGGTVSGLVVPMDAYPPDANKTPGHGGTTGKPDAKAVDTAQIPIGTGGSAGNPGRGGQTMPTTWSLGGMPTSGGSPGASGMPTSGGSPGAGGWPASGGSPGAGGIPYTGGSLGAGGTPGSGGADGGPLPGTASDATSEHANPDANQGRKLIWSDEFDGPELTGVDPTMWNYATSDPLTANNETQKYTSRTDNVFLDGKGHLVIRALNVPYGNFLYTSGRIDTNGNFSVGPGHRIEVSAKLPSGLGSVPGIIMMGVDGIWPMCGELALMEQWGQYKSWYYTTAYASTTALGSTGNHRYAFPNAVAASVLFHVYSVDLYSDHVEFQLDGVPTLSQNFVSTSPFATIPEYIVLDLALGGTTGGAIAANAFPMDLIIDYVRVYAF